MLTAIAALTLPACEDDDAIINPDPGRPSTEENVSNPKIGQLALASNPSTEFVPLYFCNNASDQLYIKLMEPSKEDVSYTIAIDRTYDFEKNIDYIKSKFNNVFVEPAAQLYDLIDIPVTNVEIKKGETVSTSTDLVISINSFCVNCVIPIVAKGDNGTEFRLFVMLTNFQNPIENREDKGLTVFAFIDTEEMNPLVARTLYYDLTYYKSRRDRTKIFLNMPLIDVVNLQKAQLKYNKMSNNVDVTCTADQLHVLKNGANMIKPLQNMGIKVCLTVQGGGDGYGFANLADDQIANVSFQIATLVETFHLDGVNLRDEGVNYEADGAPSKNSGSYPKLIKSLRSIMPDKLITLADDAGSIATMDTTVDGVEVGSLVDFVLNVKFGQYNNPWDDPERTPIAGLPKNRYALSSFRVEKNPTSEDDMIKREETDEKIFTTCIADGFDKCAVLANIPYYDYNEEMILDVAVGRLLRGLYDNNGGAYPRYGANYIYNNEYACYYAFRKDW